MQTGNIFGLVASLLVVQLAAVSAQTAGNDTSNGNGTIRVVLAVPAGNATLNLGSGTSTTAVPTTTVTSGSAGASGKNSTGSGKLGEEDCSDEDGTPEPEGAATNGTERSGKQLTLNDHEKYSHDGAAAEPEPESEPSGNSTSSAGNELEIGKLSGNSSTTPAPARGGASVAVFAGYTSGIIALIFASFYVKAVV